MKLSSSPKLGRPGGVFLLLAMLAAGVIVLSGCDREVPMAERTLIFYYPYVGNLQSYFSQNIYDMRQAIEAHGGLPDQRVMVLRSTSETACALYEIQYKKGAAEQVLIVDYPELKSGRPEGMEQVLSDIQLHAAAKRYSMVIGAHGLGWVPREDEKLRAPRRNFGGLTMETKMDISEMADCLRRKQIHLEYLLFDCCYMANVEVCFELRDVADRIIATTSELMAPGMPYTTIGQYLIGQPDYRAITNGFLDFYSQYRTPCGTLSVIDTQWMDSLANFTREMLQTHYADPGYLRTSQVLDGYSPPIFYDYGDYMAHLRLTESEQARLVHLLEEAVPYRVNTPTYYSAYTNRSQRIEHYSGLTTSACSLHPYAVHYSETAWAEETIGK